MCYNDRFFSYCEQRPFWANQSDRLLKTSQPKMTVYLDRNGHKFNGHFDHTSVILAKHGSLWSAITTILEKDLLTKQFRAKLSGPKSWENK